MIMMWSGTIATIPTGWVLCNGSNSTPDLRNKFVIGAHTDSAGVAYSTVTGSNTQSGGTKDAIVVSHTHSATVTDPGHSHTLSSIRQPAGGVVGGNSNTPPAAPPDAPTLTTQSNTTGITVANSTEGSSGTNANLPPYYALAFIMKT
jgi:hypothetical protein